MPGLREIVGEHSIGLILLRVALETVECPIGPVDVRLAEILQEVEPRDIASVAAELAQEIRVA